MLRNCSKFNADVVRSASFDRITLHKIPFCKSNEDEIQSDCDDTQADNGDKEERVVVP